MLGTLDPDTSASIVEAALPATLVLLLAAARCLYSIETALWIAVLLNVGLLFTWGVGLRQLAGGTALQALGSRTCEAHPSAWCWSR